MRKTTGLLVLATSVLWASLAGAAELGTMTFRILKKVGEGQYDTMTEEERDELFSLSNCTCNTLFAVEMTLRDALQAQTSPDDVQIWVGSNCNEFSTERDQRCFRVDDISVQSFDGRLVRIEIPVRKMVEPTAADGAACREVAAQQTIWALVDEGNDGSSYEHAWSINPAVAVDSEPPPLPVSPEARGNEDGITLSWTRPEAETEDIFGYQVLCARTDGSPLFATAPAEPSYQTPFAMCGVGEDSFERLSPRFICSGELSASATSARVSLAGVTLGPTEQIQTRLVVFDRARNAREVPISGTARPSPVTDAWELYDLEGSAEPGFCSVAVGRRGGGLGVFLLGLAALLVWRRRSLLVLPLLFLPAVAEAQVYFEETPPPRSVNEVPPSWWGLELKLGPYTPGIDDEAGLMSTPYQTMFGDGASILFQAGFERYFLQPAGQLGVGLQVGYMQKTARSFLQDPSSGMTTATRGEDKTGFRMVPAALLLVYRFTLLADRTVVPLVPYVKAGLSYYTWWFTKGGGDLAETASGEDAIGASFGWQGTLGLAVRADAIDRDAARAMREELGVEHAGFFFEMTYADVSGFGSETKLRVGDLTWAAGVNFEF